MIGLTNAQAELLEYIGWYQAHYHGVSPSFEDMKNGVGLKSKSGVHRLIRALVEKGRLRRLETRARALEIIPDDSGLRAFSTTQLIAELSRRSHVNARAA